MKRLLALLLASVMLLSLCACGKTEPPAEEIQQTTTSAEDATDSTTTAEDATDSTTAADTTTGVASDPTKAPTTTKKPATTAAPTEPEDDDDDDGWGNWEPPIPPEIIPETEPQPDNRPTMKILSIGHSFSIDAMKTYMWEMFEAAGYNTTIAYLFFPGCSLERQYHYITDNRAGYQQYGKNSDGEWDIKYAKEINKQTNEVISGGVRALTALWAEDWDIVTFQPSPDYGAGTMTYDCKWGCNKKVNDYDHFDALVKFVKDTLEDKNNPHGPNTDVKYYYHLTWAFSEDCELWSYMYSGFNQMQMYNDFLAATKKYVQPNQTIEDIIPCITSIQNARTSWMGDTFNEPVVKGTQADGYHLNDKGDLVAAMTWVAKITGKKAMDFKIGTKYSDAEYKAIAEAVDNAIAKWDAVTESSYKTKP